MSNFNYQRPSTMPTLSLLVTILLLLNSHVALCNCYKRIFSLGDSIIDSGNYVHSVGNSSSKYKEAPYGMTYFKHATGRMCDGRVLIDFYAQALQLPLIPPNLPENASGLFAHGANFAVLGATALPPSIYKVLNHSVSTPWCLGVQYGWFDHMLKRIAPGDDARRRLLEESLIVLGEIGSSDYISWFKAGRSREEAKDLIPMVVSAISTFLEWIVQWGAKVAVIPNNFPIGCFPLFLNKFHSHEPKDYDEHGCLRWFNDFVLAHNNVLFHEVTRLQGQYPGVKLIYADYYNATMELIKNPGRFGIDDPLVACCGGDGPYHASADCNNKAKVWGDPGRFVSWDGMHMTEKAYEIIAKGVLRGPFANPPLLLNCSN
ncbi:hypothetical protein EJB05_12497, partial [Eragrostis curvula]